MSKPNESMVSFISNIIQTTVGFLLNPVETFQQHDDTSFIQAFQYFGALIVFYAVLSTITIGALSHLLIYAQEPFAFGSLLFISLLSLFFAILRFISGVFFWCLFQHIFVLLMGGEYGINQTLKVIMYSSVPALIFGWILATLPIMSDIPTMVTLSLIISSIIYIWVLVLQVLGIRELHKISTARAICAVCIPVAIVALIWFLFIGYIMLTF